MTHDRFHTFGTVWVLNERLQIIANIVGKLIATFLLGHEVVTYLGQQPLMNLILKIHDVLHLQWSAVAKRSSTLDSSSGVVRMWVRIPAWRVAALVSLSKTLNHNCFVLRMGRKAPVTLPRIGRRMAPDERSLAILGDPWQFPNSSLGIRGWSLAILGDPWSSLVSPGCLKKFKTSGAIRGRS